MEKAGVNETFSYENLRAVLFYSRFHLFLAKGEVLKAMGFIVNRLRQNRLSKMRLRPHVPEEGIQRRQFSYVDGKRIPKIQKN